VKYLGIVDGSMGILSRKMAMAGNSASKPIVVEPQRKTTKTNISLSAVTNFAPVLGTKNYSRKREAELERKFIKFYPVKKRL
jgi:hypothetical protein